MHQRGAREGDVTDGRRARGARRRAEIIEAALTVVERDGASGVSHRAVATQAGTPTSLITYYFATLDDLLVAALSTVTEEYTQQLQEISESGTDEIRGLAELIASSGGSGHRRALAERELCTLAARRPALRPLARRWREVVAELAGRHTTDTVAIASLVAVSDGLCTAILLGRERPDADAIRSILLRSLGTRTKEDPT